MADCINVDGIEKEPNLPPPFPPSVVKDIIAAKPPHKKNLKLQIFSEICGKFYIFPSLPMNSIFRSSYTNNVIDPV